MACTTNLNLPGFLATVGSSPGFPAHPQVGRPGCWVEAGISLDLTPGTHPGVTVARPPKSLSLGRFGLEHFPCSENFSPTISLSEILSILVILRTYSERYCITFLGLQ